MKEKWPYVIPEEMLQFVNYPDVKTGVEFHMTPLMWGGAALILAAAVLAVLSVLKAKKTKANAADAEAEKASRDPYSKANIEADMGVLFNQSGTRGSYNPFNGNTPTDDSIEA